MARFMHSLAITKAEKIIFPTEFTILVDVIKIG
jgi:hypothetical protein